MGNLLDAVKALRDRRVCDANVVGVYHARWVFSLMERMLHLHQMVPSIYLRGTTTLPQPVSAEEVMKHLKEALPCGDTRNPLSGHPSM